MAGDRFGSGDIFDSKRAIRDWLGRSEDGGFHERFILSLFTM
jgi:hypothetical protein